MLRSKPGQTTTMGTGFLSEAHFGAEEVGGDPLAVLGGESDAGDVHGAGVGLDKPGADVADKDQRQRDEQ